MMNKRKSGEKLAGPDPKSTRSGFLKGLNIFLHPAARSLNRKKIFERQININGGTLVTDLNKFEGETVVVVIDSLSIETSKLKGLVEKCRSSNVAGDKLIFVGTNWLSGCLEKSDLLPFEQFLLKVKKVEETKSDVSQSDVLKNDFVKSDNSPKTFSTSKFVCAQSSVNPTSSNLNEAITRELEKLAQTYKSSNDRLAT
jgi:hypothetical protein